MSRIKHIGAFIAGWFFVILGIIGLFLPVLQGVLFITIGLAILSSRSELIKRLLKNFEESHPRQHQQMEAWKEKISRWFKKS